MLSGCPGLPCEPRKLRTGWDALPSPVDTTGALAVLDSACEPTFSAAARRWVERGAVPDTTTDLGGSIHEAWRELCPGGPDLVEATSPPLLDARRRTLEVCGPDALGVATDNAWIHATGSPELAALVRSWLRGTGGRDEGQFEALATAIRGAPRVVLPPDTELVLLGQGAALAPAAVDWVLTPTGLYHGAQVLLVLDEGRIPPGHPSAGKGRLRGAFAPTDDPLADWALTELRDLAASHPEERPAIAVDARVPVATLRRVAASMVGPGEELALVGMETLDGAPDRLATRPIRLPAGPPPWPPVEDGSLDVPEDRPLSDLVEVLEDPARSGERLGGAPVLAFPGGQPCLTPPEGMVCVHGGRVRQGDEQGGDRIDPYPATFYFDRAPLTTADTDACVDVGYCAGDLLGQDPANDSELGEVLCAFRGKRMPTEQEAGRAWNVGQTGTIPPVDLLDLRRRCVSSGPELNAHPSPALTEHRLPPIPLEAPGAADLSRFHATPDELLVGLPICSLDGAGVRRSRACRPARDHAPRGGGGPDRFVPYLTNSGGGFVGLGGWEELYRASRARSEWLWLITDDPARAALMRAVGALIGASPTPSDLLARLDPDAPDSSRALLEGMPVDADGIHSPSLVFEAMRRELWLACSRALSAGGGAVEAQVAWIADPDDYAHLHRLWSQGRARVLVADPAGPGWLDVGRAAHDLRSPVRVLDLDATAYARGGTLPEPFRDAVAGLPMDSRSVVLQRMELAPIPAASRSAWHFHVHGGLDYQARVADPERETAADVAAGSALTDDPRLTIAGVPGR